ncbi:MAG TPA: sigma-70 family RNA polymerase sigma factor [Draconibacterium sp.]|nr:sigma-70 family RNA polymerase sigma factor [Draconibacterium sp.]
MEVISNQSEQKLVRLCKKNDAKAQYKLYKQYSKGMYNLALRMTGDQNEAEDILQDAFIKAFQEVHKLKNEKAFGGWLRRIVVNHCIDSTRKKKLVFIEMEKIKDQHTEMDGVEESIDPGLIHAMIKKLPDGAREILVLRALEGYKHAEIGEQLGISESTAKTQYFRAKQLLAKMLNDWNNEERSGKNIVGEAIKA